MQFSWAALSRMTTRRVGTEEIDQPAPDNFGVIDKKDLDDVRALRAVLLSQGKR